jgi:dethiobiotin synthase
MASKIFIAATGRNAGKTSVSIGLISFLVSKGYRVGYMKPLAQRHVKSGSRTVAEDALLMKKVFGLGGNLEDMGPFLMETNQTTKYVQGKAKSPEARILRAYRQIERENDVIVIEGTGHAGVGSVFDLSNADVARLLNAPVVIVGEGGIGSTIDSLALNHAFFLSHGCSVLGVIVNKVRPDKYDRVSQLLRMASATRSDLRILGFIPHQSVLSAPTLSVVKDELQLQVLNGDGADSKSAWNEQIENVVVATMEPHEVMESVASSQEKTLIITSSDRSDILLGALALYHSRVQNFVGLVLSGGPPARIIMDFIRGTGLPVLVADQGIYKLASLIHGLTVKTTAEDKGKIEILTGLFMSHVAAEELCKSIFTPHEMNLSWKARMRANLSAVSEFFSQVVASLRRLTEHFGHRISP